MPGINRVLGIDPGLTRCGVAVVEGGPGQSLACVYIGVIRTSSDMATHHRLLRLETHLEHLFDAYQPSVVAIEAVFSQHNVRSAMATAQAAAVGMLLAARRDIAVATHTPTEVKAAITGNGRAEKAQVGMMVTKVLSLKEAPSPADAADAAAIAICQAWRGPSQARLAFAKAQGYEL